MRAALVAAALLFAAPAAAGTSGARGVVRIGPTMPVCAIGRACTRPAAGVTLTFSRAGVAHRTKTAHDGSYRLALAPGTYRLLVAGARFGARPRTVAVPSGRFVVRDITIDTGIR